MNMLFIAWTELKRTLKTPSQVIVLFLMPLLLIFILGSSLSRSGGFEVRDMNVAPVNIGIVRGDEGLMMEAFDKFLKSPEVSDTAHGVAVPSRERLEHDIRGGLLDFGIVVPQGFSDAVVKGGRGEWEFVLGSDYDENMIARTMVQSFLSQVNARQSAALVLGPQAIAASAGDDTAQSQPAEYVTIGKLSKDSGNYSAFQYYSVSILVMFILYSGMAAAISILNEKECRTLQRMQTQPIRPSTIVFGKLAGSAVMTMLQACFVILFTNWVYGVSWGGMWGWLLLICFLLTIVSLGLGVVLLAKAKTTKSVRSVFQYIVIAMTALSGGFAPIPGLEDAAKGTISYWGMQGMLRIMLNSEFAVILQHVAVLGLIAAALLAGSLFAYRRVIAHE